MLPVCPKCDTALLIVFMGDVEVDLCDRCRGLWLDDGELESLGGPPATDQTVIQGKTRYLCPRCDQPMRLVRRCDVELEECPRGHGIWLDAGELEHLKATPLGQFQSHPKQGGSSCCPSSPSS
ncbi:MAG: zf-TFIIB domain-containing protein [Verrucomicrobiae bacterium]|nr:zf-TFIIB domain-containing protein [Verrucomicrobiae bacterium]